MEQEISLEEGELSNDSETEYTPLKRPSNYSITQPNPRLPVVAPVIPESESEDEIVLSNDSDSDSDPNSKKIKKPKILLKPKPQQRNVKVKKYDIWSSRLQEDTLAATFNSCDVVKKDRSREVETYDYTLANQYYDNDNDSNKFREVVVERKNNKRTRGDRNNMNFRQRQKSPSEDGDVRGEPILIEELIADKNDEPEVIAKDMASKLNEEKVELILKVITVLGKEKAIDLFKETKTVEAEGGMLIQNRRRRRTPGGVFFNLVRNDYHITLDQRNQIFKEERQKFIETLKNNRKEKVSKIQKQVASEREKILPTLLTRAQLMSSKTSPTNIEESGEQEDCVNPPPTPETDCCENSRDGMEGSPVPVINKNDSLDDNNRGKLHTYDDDFLDLGCGDDMDLF